MTAARAHSLGERLSLWLALQSLVGLAAVCAGIYVAIALGLEARQTRSAEEKISQVRHLIAETLPANNVEGLRHRLDEALIGHGDMSLTLRRPDGSVLYERGPLQPTQIRAQRTRAFEAYGAGHDAPLLSGQLRVSTEDDQLLLQRIASILVAASLFGAALISAGGYLLVRMNLAPLRSLTDQIRSLSAGTLHQRLLVDHPPRELEPLVAQFNGLLGRLQSAYAQAEGFNADVAHELRTPLATLISGTEIALRRQRDAKALQETLGSNLEELQRMAGIVQDMLFLSHADRGALARRAPASSLAAAAQRVVSFHDAAFDEAGLTLAIEGDHVSAFDPPLIERALSNLLSNAQRYADRGSQVLIRIAAGKGQVALEVVNIGETIPAGHLPHLFDRFYRADAARSEGARNHGLGLAIVSAVARMHGGAVTAHSLQRRTTVGFTVADANDS